MKEVFVSFQAVKVRPRAQRGSFSPRERLSKVASASITWPTSFSSIFTCCAAAGCIIKGVFLQTVWVEIQYFWRLCCSSLLSRWMGATLAAAGWGCGQCNLWTCWLQALVSLRTNMLSFSTFSGHLWDHKPTVHEKMQSRCWRRSAELWFYWKCDVMEVQSNVQVAQVKAGLS